VFAKIFVDDVLIGGSSDWLIPLLIGMLVTAFFRAFLEYLKYSILSKTKNKLDIVTSANYFWHVLRLPINFYNQRYRGEIGGRISLNSKIAELLTGRLANNLLDIILLIFYFVLMLRYDILLTLIGTGLALLNVFAFKIITKKRAEGYLNYTVEAGKLTGVTMGGIQTIETLKAMGRENDFFIKWAGYFTKVINAGQKLGFLTLILNTTPVLLFSVSNVIILVIGGAKVMDGALTIGMLVAFQSLMTSFSQPIENLVQLGGDIQEAEGDMSRLDDVLKSKIDNQISKSEKQNEYRGEYFGKKLEGYIEFKNVTFGYSVNSPPLIENFNLKINPGERVALVGSSGSGKSTIVRLIIGFYEPWSGEILFDGKPRDYWPREVINSSLAMVSQDIFLFEGKVRDILTIWDDTVTDKMVINAAKDACIHDVIASKNHAYDYIISEGGKNLSGGQRQRIEIARSLIGEPASLILDEGTSALDPITEKMVMDNIRRRKCSVVVVAHRLSTIRDSDEILVLKNGKISERGIHSELIKLKGEYARLIEN
jgi:NHLM bacteriocin system ABC transporter peptidase/ATP-binding protein